MPSDIHVYMRLNQSFNLLLVEGLDLHLGTLCMETEKINHQHQHLARSQDRRVVSPRMRRLSKKKTIKTKMMIPVSKFGDMAFRNKRKKERKKMISTYQRIANSSIHPSKEILKLWM